MISMQYNYSPVIQSSFLVLSVFLLPNSVTLDYFEMCLCSLSEPKIKIITALSPGSSNV